MTYVYIANYVQSSSHPPAQKFEESINKKFLTQEFIPNNSNFTASIHELLNTDHALVTITEGRADIELTKKTPRQIQMKISAEDSATIEVGQFFFHGWTVLKNGENVSRDVNIRSSAPLGAITIDIPKGHYTLSLVIPPLIEEEIGLYISCISIALWMLGLIFLPSRIRQ